MRTSRLLILAIAAAIVMAATPSFAQHARGRSGGSPRAAGPIGRAVPRGVVRPRGPGAVIPGRAVRGFGYGSRRFYRGAGLYYGYPFPYGFYGSALYGGLFYGGFYSGYPWAYPGYWGPGYLYPPYWGAGYGYAPYGGAPGYVDAAPDRVPGSLRLTLPQRDAEVRVDGVYVGIVDDFDGSFQDLELEPGRHRIEISREGFQSVAFDINVDPGRRLTYRTRLRALEP